MVSPELLVLTVVTEPKEIRVILVKMDPLETPERKVPLVYPDLVVNLAVPDKMEAKEKVEETETPDDLVVMVPRETEAEPDLLVWAEVEVPLVVMEAKVNLAEVVKTDVVDFPEVREIVVLPEEMAMLDLQECLVPKDVMEPLDREVDPDQMVKMVNQDVLDKKDLLARLVLLVVMVQLDLVELKVMPVLQVYLVNVVDLVLLVLESKVQLEHLD